MSIKQGIYTALVVIVVIVALKYINGKVNIPVIGSMIETV